VEVPELVARESEFVACAAACVQQHRAADAAIDAALADPQWLPPRARTPPPPPPPLSQCLAAVAPHWSLPPPLPLGVGGDDDGSPKGEAWSVFPWWHGAIDRAASMARLQGKPAGAFLLRTSSRPGRWALDLNVVYASHSGAAGAGATRSDGGGGGGSGGGIAALPATHYLPLLVSRDPATGRVSLQRAKRLDLDLGGKDYATIRQLVDHNSEYLRTPVPRP
jgi:hypothetical protein